MSADRPNFDLARKVGRRALLIGTPPAAVASVIAIRELLKGSSVEASKAEAAVPRIERRLLLPFVYNSSFETPEGLRIVRDGRRWHFVAEKPRGWEAINLANSAYHYHEGGAAQGRSFVSADLIAANSPFGCATQGGSWQQEEGIMMRINPTRTYPLSYWARFREASEGVIAVPASEVAIYDSQGNQLDSISPSPSFSVAEGNWEQISPLSIGPEGTFGWPENAAAVRFSLVANGSSSNPDCAPGRIAVIDFDGVSFGPQSR